MAERFRLGIVGVGQITSISHLPAALAVPGVTVGALVDPCRDRAVRLARIHGISPRVAASVSEVLGDLDGVVIATPNQTHFPLAMECIEAGVHVLVEKPMATDLKSAEAIVAAAERKGVTVAVGYSTRFYPSVLLMKEILDSGDLGRATRFVCQFGGRGGWTPASDYILDRKSSGGGVLVATGSHFLDRIIAWFGYPQAVEYRDDAQGGIEANCVARFRFSANGRGIEGSTIFSKTVALPGGFVIETDRGRLLFPEGPETRIVFRPADAPKLDLSVSPRSARRGPAKPAHQLQLEDFLDACLNRRPPRISARDGVASIRLIEELYACRQPLDWAIADPRKEGSAA